ncbi:hypothetical protein DFH94DRAFT_639749, partial [Russula ochroleuca]
INHYAIPPKLLQAQEEEKKVKLQTTLDNTLVNRTEVFMRQMVLHTVAQFVACDNQAFSVANNKLFRNCLVLMRPKTRSSDVLSSHDVGVYIHNECIKWLKQLKEEITVSSNA